jgi:hypothetical protein
MKKFLVVLFAVLALCLFSTEMLCAGTYKQDDAERLALRAKGENLRPDELKKTIKKAEAGDVRAQMILAYAYDLSKSMPKDESKSFEWAMRAAKKGNPLAQRFVGLGYLNGQGVAKDEGEAFNWFTKAAEQGNVLAIANLGDFYRNGQGVDKDFGKAAECYKKADELGDPDGPAPLGDMYLAGTGVERDEKKALEYYMKAVERGNTEHAGFYLNIASDIGENNAITILLSKKADINYKSNTGRTPLMSAVVNNHLDTVKLLVEKGADLQLTDNDGRDVLVYAISPDNINPAIIKYLVEKGADVNKHYKYGNTILMLVVGKNYPADVLQAIIKKQRDINAANDSGETAVMYAVYYVCPEALEMLLKNGADVNRRTNDGSNIWTRYNQGYFNVTNSADYDKVAEILKRYGAR